MRPMFIVDGDKNSKDCREKKKKFTPVLISNFVFVITLPNRATGKRQWTHATGRLKNEIIGINFRRVFRIIISTLLE